MRRTILVCAGLLGLLLPAGTAIARPLYPLCGTEQLRSCVLNGNTFWYGGEFMRLVTINPPMPASPACADEASTERAATDRLVDLLNGMEIFVFRYGTDAEGHTLTRVLVEGKEVGETLISEHLAQPSSAANGPWCS